MSGVKLAPIKGFSEKPKVELEPLSSLLESFQPTRLTPLLKPTPIQGLINHDSLSSSRKKKKRPINSRNNEVNRLWSIYLKQQYDLGDIEDRQVMAKAYHKLSEKELNVLRITETGSSLKTKPNVTIDLRKRSSKTVNKRQKRKKLIRDELKRQLNNFISLSESEGFPWKAIVSERGYRNLRLEGWPENIPLSKRIDDFNPIELDNFEQCIKTGSIKIVTMNYSDEEDSSS